ncbi:putative PurR-regulated permease PerM [Rhodopseudomonas julia]|uniref:PurR-regulated permease PerM n=1 Tax=Rhodopseudomonas julia TaxID=200617 RepID=A0ABU0CDQ6_9BRAD|nr:AI-2E family transporter [Rhodopseudomonas julia]MDQ0327202.1 putative PurR-regulated permease PerM [Rhodopseudomonas julia]
MSAQRQAIFWLGALSALIVFLWLFSGILLPFLLGMALAYFLDPVADWLEKLGMNRLLATLAILIFALVLFIVVLVAIIPPLVGQASDFAARLPNLIERLRHLGSEVFASPLAKYLPSSGEFNAEPLLKSAATWMGGLVSSILAGGQALISFASLFIVTPVVAFYLLYDWDRMVKMVDSYLPREHADVIRALAADIDQALSGFLRGQGLVCTLLGGFYVVSLTAVGLNFGLLIGFVAGVINFIPYIGSTVGFILAVGVALVQFWPEWPWIVVVAGVFVTGQVVEGNLLQPRIVGHSVGVHPVWLMFAMFAFGALFGFVGLLVAVPVTAAIGVLVRFGLEQYRESRIYLGTGDPPPPPPSELQ